MVVGWSRHARWRARATAAIENIATASGLFLLQGGCTGLDEGALDIPSDFGREDRARVQRTRDRLLPRLQHLVQLATSLSIDQGVRIHKGLIHVSPQKQRIRGPDILDDGVDYIQGR